VISRQKALLVADLAKAKNAEDVVILDMRRISGVTDFFIIATSSSAIRSRAIADNIKEGLSKAGERVSSIEGYRETDWVLVDAYDVVTHIFSSEARSFYNLESLWAGAKKVKPPCRKKTKKRSKKTSKKR
jgi:ribosome-associated protein